MGARLKPPEFEKTLLQEISRRGKVSFAEFMAWALYHPWGGYYARGPVPIGRRGDFYTSVSVGALYGELLSDFFIAVWDALGSERITLIELGCGEGRLAEDVLKALEETGRQNRVTWHGVETGAASRELARRRLSRFRGVTLHESMESLEHTAGVEGIVYANEFFDALPVHRLVRTETGWEEIFVHVFNDLLEEIRGPVSSLALTEALSVEAVPWVTGQTVEVSLAMDEKVGEMDRLLSRGVSVFVDYGGPALDVYSPARLHGTLRAFEAHQVDTRFLEKPGQRDLTAHVNFSRLARLALAREWSPLLFSKQGPFLLEVGEQRLRRAIEGASPLERPARARQIQQLLHPETLGGAFHVLALGKNVGDMSVPGQRTSRWSRLGLGETPSRKFD